MTANSAADWFVRLSAQDHAPLQLFAFPHAGAGCATFSALANGLSGAAELHSANLPGRQARFLEPAYTELRPLIEELADAVADRLDARRYSIMGYCGGALLAYLLAMALADRDVPPPAGLIIVSFVAPHLIRIDPGLIDAPSEEFWDRIVSFGGVQKLVAAQQGARETFEGALRADYGLLASYQHTQAPRLDVPIDVISGSDDFDLLAEDLDEWSEYTSRSFDYHQIPGGHWLLEQSLDSLTERLEQIALKVA